MQAQAASTAGLESQELPPNRLRDLRKTKGWQLYDVSALVRVSPSTVHRWETGESEVPDLVKLALAEAYGVTPAHLMGWPE